VLEDRLDHQGRVGVWDGDEVVVHGQVSACGDKLTQELPHDRRRSGCMEELFPLFAPCRRLCGVLFHSQLHDPFNQVIGDRLIQWELEIALRSSGP
jgi:hypothetical protein